MSCYIELDQLTKDFGSFRAVNEVSLKVNKGEVLGFLGPNGAGKTTTMRMITGFLAPTDGRALVMGHDIVHEPLAAKQKIGYLPEGAPLYPDLSPRLFLQFVGKARGMSADKIKQRMDYVTKILHLAPVIDQAIDTLSKGFKRRVGLAQAIFHDPDILILDEPTDGLDPIQKHEVRDLIKKMAKDKAIIISTHILEEVEAVCDRAVIIAGGSIKADGTPEELLEKHAHHNAVSLTVSGTDVDVIKADLAKLKDVKKVEKLNGSDALTIIPKKGKDITHDVSKLAQKKKWTITALGTQRGKLDDVFRDIAAPKAAKKTKKNTSTSAKGK